ncbi:MAG: hypothetical protein KBD63_02270 [Bacteriovoracaceae bacterium]|nr:hypothetical protein [Bacteriovoracaceae bacterium]
MSTNLHWIYKKLKSFLLLLLITQFSLGTLVYAGNDDGGKDRPDETTPDGENPNEPGTTEDKPNDQGGDFNPGLSTKTVTVKSIEELKTERIKHQKKITTIEIEGITYKGDPCYWKLFKTKVSLKKGNRLISRELPENGTFGSAKHLARFEKCQAKAEQEGRLRSFQTEDGTRYEVAERSSRKEVTEHTEKVTTVTDRGSRSHRRTREDDEELTTVRREERRCTYTEDCGADSSWYEKATRDYELGESGNGVCINCMIAGGQKDTTANSIVMGLGIVGGTVLGLHTVNSQRRMYESYMTGISAGNAACFGSLENNFQAALDFHQTQMADYDAPVWGPNQVTDLMTASQGNSNCNNAALPPNFAGYNGMSGMFGGNMGFAGNGFLNSGFSSGMQGFYQGYPASTFGNNYLSAGMGGMPYAGFGQGGFGGGFNQGGFGQGGFGQGGFGQGGFGQGGFGQSGFGQGGFGGGGMGYGFSAGDYGGGAYGQTYNPFNMGGQGNFPITYGG